MAARDQDTVLAQSVYGMLFPDLTQTGAAAWNYVPLDSARLDNATDAFAALLRARGLAACPPGCPCTITARCGKDYEPVTVDIPIFGVGYIMGMVISSIIFIFVVIVELRRYIRPRNTSGYTPIH